MLKTDRIKINGTEYTAELDVAEKGGNTAAIRGGRILYYLLSREGVAVALFEKGDWMITISEEDDEAGIASTYFVTKWSKEPSVRIRKCGE